MPVPKFMAIHQILVKIFLIQPKKVKLLVALKETRGDQPSLYLILANP